MKHKKDKIIIVALSSLVLFSSSIALMLYLKGKNTVSNVNIKTVQIYVASKELKKSEQLSANSIKLKSYAQEQINFPILTKEEIIGKYTNMAIYKDEPMRLEKLSVTKSVDDSSEQVIKIDTTDRFFTQYDAFTLPLSMFQNIDFSLKSGDLIDIVSIANPEEKNLKTRYAALQVKVLGFSKNGENIKSYISYKKTDKEVLQELADTVILDMKPRYIKNVLSLYYETQSLSKKRINSHEKQSGHLWIVKTQESLDKKMLQEKEKLLVDNVVKRYSSKKVQKAKISYEK